MFADFEYFVEKDLQGRLDPHSETALAADCNTSHSDSQIRLPVIELSNINWATDTFSRFL
jgi:hypothetical protein